MAGATTAGGWPASNYASVPAPGGGGYGALPRPVLQRGKGGTGGVAFSRTENVLLVAVPSMVSVVIFCLFANVYQRSGWPVALFVAVLGLGAVAVQQRSKTPLTDFLAYFSMAALFLSTTVGLAAYNEAFSNYWFLHDSNAYSNVLATESAAGYADAGKLVFADGTRVDAGKALGYKDGQTYCVAPIIDEMMNGAVEFWAVGIDCCSVRGSFWCDDAWNPKARSGVVMDDTIVNNTAEFAAAIRQAEAAFEIPASTKPLTVRWVVDPEQMETNYRVEGVAVLFSAFLVQTLLFALATLGRNTTAKGLVNLIR